MRKEWALMKWGLVSFMLASIAIAFFNVSHVFYGVPEDFATTIQTTSVLCFLIHMVAAMSWFFDSLNKEMKRPDMWLHCPASMWQLVGAKVLFITIIIGCSFLLWVSIVGTAYYIGGGTASVVDAIALLLSVGVVILLNAIYVMGLVFFFWSIYQVFRSRISWLFSVVIMFVSFIIWAYVWGIIWFTEMFQTVKELGPLNGSMTMMEPNYIVPGGAILTIGSMALYGVMTAFYVGAGSMLFDKKVRL